MSKTTHSATLGELIKMAQVHVKAGFTDSATMMGGGAPPGGDPMAAAGGDPMAAAGGAPPPSMPADPAAGAAPPMPGGGGDPFQMILDKLNQMGSGGGGAGAGGPPIKPKIDVNVELMLIKNMLAKICDALKIPIPAQDMVATPEKLMGMAQAQQSAGGAAAPPQSAIAPIEPMQAAGPGMGMEMGGGGGEKVGSVDDGEAFGPITQAATSMNDLSAKSRAIALLMSGGT